MTQEEIIEIIDDVIVDIIETHHDDTKVLERLQKNTTVQLILMLKKYINFKKLYIMILNLRELKSIYI